MNMRNLPLGALWLLLTVLIAALLWGAACRESTKTSSDDDDDVADDDVDDDDVTPPDTTPPDPPVVDPVYSPTFLELQTLTGAAEPGARITISGGLDVVSAIVEADGAWCLTVNLNTVSMNTLSVRAIDAADNASDPTIVQIEQIATDEPSNQALDKPATASSTSTGHPENSPDKAVDGDENTQWDNSTNHFNPHWLKVYLEDFIQIEQVRIVWNNADNAYADEYEIRVNPERYSDTAPTEDEWVTVYVQNNGQGGTETIDLPTPFGGWWVAILLKHSVSSFPLYNEYEIKEFEAWGYPYTEPDLGCN